MEEKHITERECEVYRQLQRERFVRDKERLDDLEKLAREMSVCNTRLAALVEAQTKQLNDHETRLDSIEQRPGSLWDKVISGIVSAVVAAVVAIVFKVNK